MIPRFAGQVVVGAAALVLAALATPAEAHFLTERVSLGPSAVQAKGCSYSPATSADGRFVAF